MKVLVSGGAGFIGGYVVDRLCELGHEVTIFDRRSPWWWARNRHVEYFLGDIRDKVAVHEAVAIHEGVIHTAGVLGTQETINEPLPSIETNIHGSLNIFNACHHYKVPCSYITVGNHWMNNSYSITKTTAERFAWMFNREHGTRISVTRALNAYGPRQKAWPVKKIIPNFVVPALKDKDIMIYGDGSQIMDMIFVADVADILIRALLVDHGKFLYNPREGDDATSCPKFEAGTGRHTTVREIAELVIKKIGYGRIQYVPMRPGEPEGSVVVGNPETLRPLYEGKIPSLTSLEEGLDTTIDYYRILVNA